MIVEEIPGPPIGHLIIKRVFLSNRPKTEAAWGVFSSFVLFMLFFSIYHEDLFGFSKFVASSSEAVFGKHEYWRLFTAVFVHADLMHLLSNSLFFGGLAFLLGGYFGFFIFPVLTVFAGALIQYISLMTYESGITLVGSSGVVYFMAAFWLALYCGIERRISILQRLMSSGAFTLVLLIPTAVRSEVSERTHLIGYITGWIAGGIYFFIRRKDFRKAEQVQWVSDQSESIEELSELQSPLPP